MNHFFADKKGCLSPAQSCWNGAGVFSMRDGHLWENVFAMIEGRAVRPEAVVQPEVATLAMGYDDENDVIARRG